MNRTGVAAGSEGPPLRSAARRFDSDRSTLVIRNCILLGLAIGSLVALLVLLAWVLW